MDPARRPLLEIQITEGKPENLLSSFTPLRFLPCFRTRFSLDKLSCNTHCSGLLGSTAALAWTTGIRLQQAVYRTALSVS